MHGVDGGGESGLYLENVQVALSRDDLCILLLSTRCCCCWKEGRERAEGSEDIEVCRPSMWGEGVAPRPTTECDRRSWSERRSWIFACYGYPKPVTKEIEPRRDRMLQLIWYCVFVRFPQQSCISAGHYISVRTKDVVRRRVLHQKANHCQAASERTYSGGNTGAGFGCRER